jgi:hypothetical protein
MSESLGRAAVRYALAYLRRRYRWQIRIGLGVSAAALAIAAFLVTRSTPEG